MMKILWSIVLFSAFCFNIAFAGEAPQAKVNNEGFDFAQMAVGSDPIEPVNRVMSSIEHVFLRWIFRPIGYAYGSIMPHFVIKGFNNFTTNAGFPVPMFSCFLQGKFGEGGIVFVRFMSNTMMTAGFWDPAAYWFGLPPSEEDFGQAFASWGIGRGFFIGVPSMSGNNIRDTVGMVFDAAADPKTYIYGGQYFTFLNSTMSKYDSYEDASMGNWDSYVLFRDMGAFNRDIKVRDWDHPKTLGKAEIELKGKQAMPGIISQSTYHKNLAALMEPMPEYQSQGASTDTLRFAMTRVQAHGVSFWPRLSLWNRADLVHLFRENTVEVRPERPKLNYRYLAVKDEPSAPLVVLVPGLGGSYLNSMSDALAEMLWHNGYQVVLISNPFSWEFMEGASSVKAPGYAPVDAADMRLAVKKILEDLKNRYEIRPVRRSMMGYSMGAYYTLYAAEQESRDDSLNFDRYVAINPPVNLVNSLIKLDEFYDTWKIWGREVAYERGLIAAAKYLSMLNARHSWEGYSPVAPVRNFYLVPVENEEARMLIGYSFKRTLNEIMTLLYKKVQSPDYSWGNRQALYNKFNNYNFRYYAENIMLPMVQMRTGKKVGLEQLAHDVSLKALADFLKKDTKIRVIHSVDDFLESDAERLWLAEVLGEKLVFMQHGAHLGNIYTRAMHDYILKMLDSGMPEVDNLPYRSRP